MKDVKWEGLKNSKVSLREKCPNTEFFLVRIFLYPDWRRRFTEYISIFSPNTGKYGSEKAPYLDTFHAVYSSATSLVQLTNLLMHWPNNPAVTQIFYMIWRHSDFLKFIREN